MIGEMIFTVSAFAFFIYIFFYKMIKKNDTSYVIILGCQALGILINLLHLLFDILNGTVFSVISTILCIVIPILLILLELRNINLIELLYLAAAKSYLIVGNRKMAKKILVNLVSKYNESYLGHKMLAEIYEKEGGMRKAIDEYVQVLDIKKNDQKSYFKISQLLKDLDKKDEAIEMLQNLVKIKPENYEASVMLGDLLCEKEKFNDAISLYMMLLKYYPDKFEIYYNLGIIHTMMNNFQMAKEYYEKASELNHDFVNGYYRLGQISLLYRDMDQAEENFKMSLEGETKAGSSFELAKIYTLKNQPSKATMYANKAVEIEPKYYKKVQEEPVLSSVKKDVRTPEENVQLEKIIKSDKEKMVDEHLENTQELTKKINLEEAKEKGININEFRWEKGIEKQRIDPT